MTLALRSLLSLACSAVALSARAALEEAQDVPWRQAAVVGTLLGHALSGHVVVGLPEKEKEHADQLGEVDFQGDAHDRLEIVLADFFDGPGSPDEAIVLKLLYNLRYSGGLDDDLAERLQISFREAQAQQQASSLWESRPSARVKDDIIVPYDDRGQYIHLLRFRPQKNRALEDLSELHFMLAIMPRVNSIEGVFLKALAQSHSVDEFEADPDTEVLIMWEPYIGTLDNFVDEYQPSFHQTMRIFLEVCLRVEGLQQTQLPHIDMIEAQNVYIKRNIADPESLVVALSPALLLPFFTSTETDSSSKDIAQLGTLLRWLLDRPWPSSLQSRVRTLEAFATALECGAIRDGATIEIKALLKHVLDDETSKERLNFWRIDFIRRVVATPECSPEEAKTLDRRDVTVPPYKRRVLTLR